MTRIAFILLCGVLTGAAAKHHPAPVPLPLPPLPPAQPQGGEAAPMPDRDVQAPTVALNERTTIRPHVFSFSDHSTALGFNPGAQYQAPQERDFWQPLGFNVRVPLH